MATTRAATRKRQSATRKYRARVSTSNCRGKERTPCGNTKGCKMSNATSKRKSFCRKRSNKKL